MKLRNVKHSDIVLGWKSSPLAVGKVEFDDFAGVLEVDRPDVDEFLVGRVVDDTVVELGGSKKGAEWSKNVSTPV